MPTPRILINEDSPEDLKHLLEELQRAHLVCETQASSSEVGYRQALENFRPDLIISDFNLADFDGLQALSLAKEYSPQTPVVILTNALNEEIAVECMKRGAADYVLKNRLPSIIPAITTLLERRRVASEKARLDLEHRQLFRLTPNLFCITNEAGLFLDANDAWTSRLGYNSHELAGRRLHELVHAEDLNAFLAWWSEILAPDPGAAPVSSSLRSTEFECRIHHHDGRPRHIVWNASRSPGEARIYAYGHDVTERMAVEAALRESEARFRAMADSAPVLMWVADTDLRFVYFNRPWLDFTGRPIESQLRDGWTHGVHPDDLPRLQEVLQNSYDAQTPFRLLFRLRRRDGAYRWILDYGVPRFDSRNLFLGYIGSCIDITEQHEAEAALTQRAVKQNALVNFSSFALARHPFSTLLNGAVRTVSDTLLVEHCQVLCLDPSATRLILCASLTQDSDSEPLNSTVCSASPAMFTGRMLLLPDDMQAFPNATGLLAQGIRNGLAVIIGGSERPYGLLVAATTQNFSLSGDSASFLQSIANILSTVHARNRAEEALAESEQKLLQSQKMEAVGLLAGGVAHDFNNLLTAVRCYAEILKDDLAEQAPTAQSKVSEILKATTRASALTRQLLAFSRKQVVQPEVMDLNHVINDLKEILKSLLSENIEFEHKAGSSAATVRADRGQLEQVIFNLAINARDAMPQGGRLTLRASSRLLSSQDRDTGDLAPGPYVELRVSDTGTGMSPEVQARLFEPFFTTKPKGRGTGLGLATCNVIVKNAGGAIRCSSLMGEGTSFMVLLPEVREEEFHLENFEDETPQGRQESVLLVEDDESVRLVTEHILRSLNYKVHVEPGGAEALALCLSPQAPHFDLLFTDIVMPYIGGHELSERLTALRPGLKVLFMSGYVDDSAVLQAVQDNRIPFLEKPFNRETLAKKLREALEGR